MIRNESGPRVVIVILTHNGWDDTKECLDSLGGSENADVEILVVDNASTDGTPARLKAAYPHVTILEQSWNLGYASGNNIGLSYAVERGAEFALILNNDTVAAPDMVNNLIQAADRRSKAALVGPMVYYFDEPGVIQSAGGAVTTSWRFYHRARNEEDKGQFREDEQVVWLTGCALLIRLQALTETGLFDPRFYMYGEETDLCLRARKAGYDVVFAPSAKIWHKGVQRLYKPSPAVTYYSARNELFLLSKHNAGKIPLSITLMRHLRTLASWSIRRRWRNQRRHRDALANAILDYLRDKTGPSERWALGTPMT